ncbi:MAG: alpha-glucuronidase [Asticcacaulis sp.]
MQTRQGVDSLNISDAPKVKIRSMDHWDNLTGTIERGYAGFSIFDWWRLPDVVDPRLTDYARAEASIGVNAVVLNNVGAKSDSLTHDYLVKTAAIAQVFRPYGIRVYLSARWTAPMELGGLKTADPLDPDVQKWWNAKADEIYGIIPDFGGFLVKANSEGQPGPGDYGRNHAQGANMLAAALKPHGGIVMWRAFVYSEKDSTDRAKQAYNEFKPVEGQFADNVLLQIKNGPIDFQPREPFHPLFGAMPKTNEMLEVQITKEYLGQATHLVYLGALYEEVLKADTYAEGKGSTVASITDGALDHHTLTGMAGVSNVGDDRNWTGLDFDQANWYAYGRLAWDPEASSRDIAVDWLRMTFSNDPRFVAPMTDMMMRSRETVVKYMTPLGLHHQFATGHHYGPGPWVCDLARPEWNPCYYAQADKDGVGFDRTQAGSDALGEYAPPVQTMWADPKTSDDKYLLWFHHLPWTFKMKDGQTLWNDMVGQYDQGVAEVTDMQAQWAAMEPYVDHDRFVAVVANLNIQAREAKWWRDAMIAYFESKNGLPLPAGHAAPGHDLDYYEKLDYPYAPGHPVQ